jgi:hypothetical protein
MMRYITGLVGLAGVVIAAVLFAPAPTAMAATPSQPAFNILTSPLPIKISTSPGKTVTTEIRFKNLNDTPEAIKVSLLRFGASGEEGAPDLFDITPKDKFGSWVTFSPSEVVAQPNVWNTITMTIKVPDNADLGYYMAVTLSPASTVTDPRNGASLKGSAATLVLLNVNTGNEKRSLNIAEFTSSKGLYEYLPTTFNVKLRNNGNIYIAPSGNLFITHGSKQVAALDFNQAGASVLPGTNRTLKADWHDGFPLYTNKIVDGKTIPDKHAVPQQDLKWDFSKVNKLRIGRYTAKILVVYDDGKQDVPLEATVNFWVLPWKIMLVALLIVVIIGIGLFSFIRGLVRRARSRGSKTAQRRGAN